MDDPFDLQRFVIAQDDGGTFTTALEELGRGRKRSHWMWFVFPQIAGLGQSPTSRMYAISSLQEARAYLRHPILGPRLIQCAAAVDAAPGRSARQIFGVIDAQKLRSSMTLFRRADPAQPEFAAVLDHFFDGRSDPGTDQRL